MMDISYIPCISLPGGELKHGPIALISQGSPVVAVVPTDSKLSLWKPVSESARVGVPRLF